MTVKIDEVRKVLASTFEIPIEQVHGDCSNQTIERWDSIGHINLMMALEQHFGLRFTTEEIMQMSTLAAICAVLEGKGSEPMPV